MWRNGTAPYMEILVERIRVEVAHLRAGEHQSIVVRLVAVAVDQHDVIGPNQRLPTILLRSTCRWSRRRCGRAPKARAAYSCATFSGPTGSRQGSRPPDVAEVSAMNSSCRRTPRGRRSSWSS